MTGATSPLEIRRRPLRTLPRSDDNVWPRNDKRDVNRFGPFTNEPLQQLGGILGLPKRLRRRAARRRSF